MKRYRYIFLFFLLSTYSCTKVNQDVHFHGRVVFDFPSNAPLSNWGVIIERIFDNGQSQVAIIGQAKTDNNGYYSLVSNVRQIGEFKYYKCRLASTVGEDVSYDNGDDIEMSIIYPKVCFYKFHIKNVAPAEGGDVFTSLNVSIQDYNKMEPLISNLYGANIDTSVCIFYAYPKGKVYKYYYSINGVSMSSPLHKLAQPNCTDDTLLIDVFY